MMFLSLCKAALLEMLHAVYFIPASLHAATGRHYLNSLQKNSWIVDVRCKRDSSSFLRSPSGVLIRIFEQIFCCSLLCKPNKLFQSMPELQMLHNDLQASMMEHFGLKIFLSIKLPVPVNVKFGPPTPQKSLEGILWSLRREYDTTYGV